MRHMRLALHEEVFLEQMAVTSAILDHSVAERIRKSYKAEGRFADRMSPVKSLFVEYLMEEDGANLTIPAVGDQYETQRYITCRLRRLCSVNPVEDPTLSSTKNSADEPILGVLCTVDWFDPEKGFGFVDIEGQTEQAFLRLDKLEEAGIKRAFDGDKLLCDVTRNVKGLYVQTFYETKNSAVEVEEADGVSSVSFETESMGSSRFPRRQRMLSSTFLFDERPSRWLWGRINVPS
jgi:CspA family cold shock protein